MKKKGFTLVELIAVIVILAVLLVIAVPKIMSIIEDAKKATFNSTVKMVIDNTKKKYVENQTLGITEEIKCEDIVTLNKDDYGYCDVSIINGEVNLILEGKGDYDNLVEYGRATNYIKYLFDNEKKREENGLTNNDPDKNIRYSGSNPNNYVYYNCDDKDNKNIKYGEKNYNYKDSCEVWRIIGVFDVDDGSGKKEKRVKLIREALPIKMAYDSSVSTVNAGQGINQWGESGSYEGSDLMIMLNKYYIGKESACKYCNSKNQETCTNDCTSSIKELSKTSLNMVKSTLWNLGAINYNHTMLASVMYTHEKKHQGGKFCEATSTFNSEYLCTDTVVRKTEWNGVVGLIYPSDYAYASMDNNCVNDMVYDNSTCHNQNWLQPNAWYWTLSPHYSVSYAARTWFVGNTNSTDVRYTSHAGDVRPSLYLKSSIKINSGNGTSELPYILSL